MEWPERAARNEALFREVNEQIARAGAGFRSHRLRVICECSRDSCAETFELRVGDYEEVRERGERFAILAEHIEPEIERVVEEKQGYVVVEKRGTGADIARRLNPRSPG